MNSSAQGPDPTAHELDRLAALRALQILDSEPEREFDDVTRVAATLCDVPIATVSLIDSDRQWFKARVGMDAPQTHRDLSFCSWAIRSPETVLEIPDTLEDERWATHDLVLGPPYIRFYCGVPLVVDGFAVGTLCVIDIVPRTLTREQRSALSALARGVVTAIKNRRATAALIRAESRRVQAERDLTVFSSAIAHAHDAILIFTKRPSTKGWPRVTFANAAWGRMIGRDPATSIGRGAEAIAPVGENAKAFDRIDWTAQANLPTAAQITIPRSDGNDVTVEVTIAALPATIKGLHWVVILRDLSDRLASERAEREAHREHVERVALGASERRLRDLFDRTPAITYTLDRELFFRSSLGGGLRTIGLEPDQLVGSPLSAFLDASGDRERRAISAHRRALKGESVSYEHEGFGRLFQTFLEPLTSELGGIDGVAAITFDMTDHKASVQALATTEAHLARTQRGARIGTWFHDLDTGRQAYSEELHRIFGVAHGRAGRRPFLAQVVAEDRERVRAAVKKAYATRTDLTLEYRIDSGVASRWVMESIAFAVDDGGRPRHVDGIVIDITERRAAELEVARLADTDGITGLPNRTALVARIAALPAGNAALVVIGLDRFRATNDAFGYTIGDRILRDAAQRIGESAPGAFAARLEGDAFAILLDGRRDPRGVADAAREAFAAPFSIDRYRIFATASVGFANREADETPESFIRHATMAVAAAKAAGGNATVDFDDETALRHRRRVSLDRDVRGALERREFAIVYQPVVDAGGEIARIEALLRWNHAEWGAVSPGEFVPIAEANGEILPIGRYVLHAACSELRALREATGSRARLAVNVSARQFADPELLPTIEDALASAGLTPSDLELEITESTIVSDPQRTSQLLAEIRATGTTVSIDDFGTGYSSLAALQRLPIDALKIDRSFIAATPGDPDACAIVEAILDLAKRLSLEVVAEGVESAEQGAFLTERGCTLLQGYHFGRPMEPQDLATRLGGDEAV